MARLLAIIVSAGIIFAIPFSGISEVKVEPKSESKPPRESDKTSKPDPRLTARIDQLIKLISLKPNMAMVNQKNVVLKEPDHKPYNPDGTRNQDFTVRPDYSHPELSQAMNIEQNRESWTKELIKIGKPAVPALVKALTNEDYEYRHYYARALGGIKDKRAVPAILKYYQDGVMQVNMSKLIRNSGDQAAAAECESKGRAMKKAAWEALEHISEKKYGDDFAKWKKWWDENKSNVDAIPVPKHHTANPVREP